MKSGVIIFILFFIFSSSNAQQYNPKGGSYGKKKSKYRTSSSRLKRNPTDVFPLDQEFKLNGWFAAIGGTYMLPMSSGEENTYVKQAFNDSTVEQFGNYTGKPSGKLGIYLAGGWFHSFQNPSFFHFMDVGISYRQYKGSEDFSGSYNSILTDTLGNEIDRGSNSVNQTDNYSDQILSLDVNFTHHLHFSRYGFIQNTIGVNADYFLSKSRDAGPVFPGYTATFPNDIQAQIHYRFGVGWKATPTLLIIPSVEIPVLTGYEFDSFKSSLMYFSSRHYPILFSVRFMFLRRMSEDCIVPEYDGPSNFN